MKPDLAVTIVCGDQYRAMAELVVPRVNVLLGLEVALELVEPVTVENSRADTRRARMRACCKAKFELLKRYPGRRIMFFDLDWVPLRAWDWSAMAASFETEVRRAFVGVRWQLNSGERHFDGGNAINGGFWIASPEHRSLFEDAARRWEEQGDPKRWLWEETFLTQAFDAARLQVAWLPSSYNLQCSEENAWIDPPYAAHACFADNKLALVRRLCEEHPLPRDTEPAPPPSGGVTWREPGTGQHYGFVAGTPRRLDGSIDVDRLEPLASSRTSSARALAVMGPKLGRATVDALSTPAGRMATIAALAEQPLDDDGQPCGEPLISMETALSLLDGEP